MSEENDDEYKEVYAHFGRAIHGANLLEHGIVNALLYLELLPLRAQSGNKQNWHNAVDTHYDKSFEATLGQLKKRIVPYFSNLHNVEDLMKNLEECLEKRNFLVHHFFREKTLLWHSPKGRQELIDYLNTVSDLFERTDKQLDSLMQPIGANYGITQEIIEQVYNEMVRDAEAY